MDGHALLQRLLNEQKEQFLSAILEQFPSKDPLRRVFEAVHCALIANMKGDGFPACAASVREPAQEALSHCNQVDLLRCIDLFELSALDLVQTADIADCAGTLVFSLSRFFCEMRKFITDFMAQKAPFGAPKPGGGEFVSLGGAAQFFDEMMHQILNPSIGPDSVLKFICEKAIRLTAAEAVAIYTIDRDTHAFVLKQFLSGPAYQKLVQENLPEFLKAFTSVPRTPGGAQGLFHVALSEKRPVFSENIATDPRVHMPQVLELLGIQSILVVPMHESNNELGFMSAVPAPGQSFNQAEVQSLTLFADTAAVAWRNAELYSELRNSEKKYRDIIDNAIDIIFVLNKEGRFISANKRAEEITGHKVEHWIGRHFSEIVEDEDMSVAMQSLSYGLQGRAEVLPIRIKSARGENILLKVNSSLIEENGEIRGVMCIARDATGEAKREAESKKLHASILEANRKLEDSMAKLKSAQAKLVQTEKLSAMGELISGIAHELNNPLTGIMGYTQLLLEAAKDEKQLRDLEKINTAALRCKQIIQNLLRFSRSHKPQKQNVDVNAIIKSVIDLKRYQLQLDGITLELHLDPDAPQILGDYFQLQQVSLNIINNAHQAIYSKRRVGTIEVRTELDAVGRKVRVLISDDGPGIAQDVLPRVFDPFFTTKETGAGTGLGLSVAYGIMKEHGGQITAESIPDKRTTFLLDFPLDTALEREREAPLKPPTPSRQSRILIVDDEEVILDLLTDILTQMDRRVERAHNGAEALEKVKASSFDVIICDLKMPGMDGKTFYRNVKRLRPELSKKIVFSTGDTLSEDFRAFCAEIDRKVVEKPFLLEDLKNAIEAAEQEQAQP